MPSITTDLMHHGDDRTRHHGAINTPVYRASLFSFPTYQDFLDAHIPDQGVPVYSRIGNPTRDALEAKIALLERGDCAIAFSSGMGAISCALLSFLRAGDHLLMVDAAYGPAREISNTLLRHMGVEVEFFGSDESHDLSGRIKPNTRVIYLESPGSLTFEIQNIRAVTCLAKQRGITTMIDNSWATPLYQQPLTMGVDIVLHSGTKYVAGHSDVVVGLLACNRDTYATVAPIAAVLGACLSPDDAYLVTRGLRTMPVRMAQQSASALRIAQWLLARPEVHRVLHPGLPQFPQYEIARQQMQGCSSLFGFTLHAHSAAAQHAFVNHLRFFSIGVSWGGFESLLLPVGATFPDDPVLASSTLVPEERYRISVGLEDVDDLIADLEAGFDARARMVAM
jgi:cysteine-S-conjugate beta-lyase